MRTSLKFTSGTLPVSMLPLNAFSSSMNAFTLPSRIFLTVSQLRSLSRTFPFLPAGTDAMTLAMSTSTPLNTSRTPSGGTVMVRQLPRSFLSRVSRALMALLMAGSAAARSFCASAASASTRVWISATFSASTFAFAVSTSTPSFSALTRSAISSLLVRFSSASSIMVSSLLWSIATASLASFSLVLPFFRRSTAASFSSRFWPSIFPYSFRSSR